MAGGIKEWLAEDECTMLIARWAHEAAVVGGTCALAEAHCAMPGIVEQNAPRSWRVPNPLLRNFLLELDSGG